MRARLLRDAEGSISALLCPALARVLQPRQWRGVRWLYAAAMRGGGVLGDDPGLGKTLQAIAVAEALVRGQHLLLQPRPPPPGPRRLIPLSLPPPPLRSLLQVHSGRACRVLVVAPANLVANWVAELRRWLGHTPHALAVQAVDGSSYMRATAQLCRFAATRPPDHAVAIVSYEMLHTHGDALRVGAGGVDLLVADEAHRLRREGGGRAAAVAAMPAVHRILLTATPLANNLPELYSLATLARPGALGTRDEFRDDFERPILAGWRRRWACSSPAGRRLRHRHHASVRGPARGGLATPRAS